MKLHYFSKDGHEGDWTQIFSSWGAFWFIEAEKLAVLSYVKKGLSEEDLVEDCADGSE